MATVTKKPQIERLSIQLRKDIKRDQVDQLLERIYRLNGCLTCGLNGFDIELLAGPRINPEVLKLNEAKLAGVVSVTTRAGF